VEYRLLKLPMSLAIREWLRGIASSFEYDFSPA